MNRSAKFSLILLTTFAVNGYAYGAQQKEGSAKSAAASTSSSTSLVSAGAGVAADAQQKEGSAAAAAAQAPDSPRSAAIRMAHRALAPHATKATKKPLAPDVELLANDLAERLHFAAARSHANRFALNGNAEVGLGGTDIDVNYRVNITSDTSAAAIGMALKNASASGELQEMLKKLGSTH